MITGVAPTTLGESGTPAVDITLRTGNTVLLGYYSSSSVAATLARQIRAVAKANHYPTTTSMVHADGNIYVAWRKEPATAEVHAVEGCLR